MYSSFSRFRLHSKFIYTWCYFQAFNSSLFINLLYVPCVLQNVTEFVQQIYNIQIYGNMRECFKYQTLLIYILHFLEKCNINNFILQTVHSVQSHVTTSAQYPITCYNQCTVSNHMYLDSHLPTKTCEAARCVCSIYRPAHHMN